MKNKFLMLAAVTVLSTSAAFAGDKVPANNHKNSQVSEQKHKAANKKIHKKASKNVIHSKAQKQAK